MTAKFESNVSSSEQARRFVIGAAILGVLLANPSLPAWIALLACYPIFTAMIQWDPVNAFFQATINKFRGSRTNTMFLGQSSAVQF